ncbi:hypothetical protein [Actinocorallia longicatena]|uniref:Guanylate cyclase domain-containing protein n=1 Tax=Actinocorallia longicatena TaxID=111803 RepID=A0ABP6QEQ6_9ACTN
MEKTSALLTVDAEGFSTHRDVDQPRLHIEMRRAVDAACASSGLDAQWAEIPFKESTGDGLLAVLPRETIPDLVDRFPARLQDILASMGRRLRGDGLSLRLRVALHEGLVDDDRPGAPGISAATTEVCRIVDGVPLRDALTTSDPHVTYTAFAVSREIFGPYIQGGRTDLRESQFDPVEITVKGVSRPAYLRVPVPSRRLDPPPAPEETPPAPASHPAPAPGHISLNDVKVRGDNSQNVIGSHVAGSVHQIRS